jgi:hypothetical protein
MGMAGTGMSRAYFGEVISRKEYIHSVCHLSFFGLKGASSVVRCRPNTFSMQPPTRLEDKKAEGRVFSPAGFH